MDAICPCNQVYRSLKVQVGCIRERASRHRLEMRRIYD